MAVMVPLSAEFWTFARAQARQRTQAREGRQTAEQRRHDREADVSLMGVVGEMVARRLWPGASHPGLAGSDGPVDVLLGGNAFDVKCCFLIRGHRYFLVNDAAHQRRKAAGVDYYLPVITAPDARAAVVGRAIPVADVDRWEILDPRFVAARAVELKVAAMVYFGMPLEHLYQTVQGHEGKGDDGN